jgi:hypothetical protein
VVFRRFSSEKFSGVLCRIFGGFAGVFEGGFGKSVFFVMVFCGEVVVDCW